jgi:hypothetical protein
MILRPYIKYHIIKILFMLKFPSNFLFRLVFPLRVRPPVFATRFSFVCVFLNHPVFLRVFRFLCSVPRLLLFHLSGTSLENK